MDEGKIRQHSVCGDACKCKDGIGLILFFYLKSNTWNVQKMSSRCEADLLPPCHHPGISNCHVMHRSNQQLFIAFCYYHLIIDNCMSCQTCLNPLYVPLHNKRETSRQHLSLEGGIIGARARMSRHARCICERPLNVWVQLVNISLTTMWRFTEKTISARFEMQSEEFEVQQQNDSLEVGTVTKQSWLLTPWTPQHLSEIRFFKVGIGLPDDKGSTRCSQQLTYYTSVIF